VKADAEQNLKLKLGFDSFQLGQKTVQEIHSSALHLACISSRKFDAPLEEGLKLEDSIIDASFMAQMLLRQNAFLVIHEF
jgi:hypothetical protein